MMDFVAASLLFAGDRGRSFWRHGGNTVVFWVIGDWQISLRPIDFLVATKIHLLDQGSLTGTHIGEIKHVW